MPRNSSLRQPPGLRKPRDKGTHIARPGTGAALISEVTSFVVSHSCRVCSAGSSAPVDHLETFSSPDCAAAAPEGTEKKFKGSWKGSFPARTTAGVLNTPKVTKMELAPWVKAGGVCNV